jgi:hypothetical protein
MFSQCSKFFAEGSWKTDGFPSDNFVQAFMKHPCSGRIRLIALLFICAAPSLFAETVWLSSLDLSQMTAGWSVPKVDRPITGQPIVIAKKRFNSGVGTHAASNFRVDVGGHAARFIAQVGVDDDAAFTKRLLVAEGADAAVQVSAAALPSAMQWRHTQPLRGGFILRLNN